MESEQKIIEGFGQAVQGLRIERGLSQEDLAEATGMHRTYISDVERGTRNTSLVNAKKVAVALDVPLADLIKLAESCDV